MTTALTIDIPNDLYETLKQLATHASLTPEQWVIMNLRRQVSHPVRDPNLRRLFGSVNLGVATGLENQSIDADLAQQYASINAGE